jgi:hypothetical protein
VAVYAARLRDVQAALAERVEELRAGAAAQEADDEEEEDGEAAGRSAEEKAALAAVKAEAFLERCAHTRGHALPFLSQSPPVIRLLSPCPFPFSPWPLPART